MLSSLMFFPLHNNLIMFWEIYYQTKYQQLMIEYCVACNFFFIGLSLRFLSLSLSLSLSLPDLFLKWKYNYYAVDICSNNIFVSCLVKNILYFRPVRLISDLFFLLWWSEENYHKMQFWNRNVFYCSDALSILTTHNALFAYFGLVAMCVVCDQNILCLFYNTKSHLYILVSLLQASGHTHNISFLYNTFALCLLVPQRLF